MLLLRDKMEKQMDAFLLINAFLPMYFSEIILIHFFEFVKSKHLNSILNRKYQ